MGRFRWVEILRPGPATSLGLAACMLVLSAVVLMIASDSLGSDETLKGLELTFSTPTDAALQARVEGIDATLRAKFKIDASQTAVGVLDLRSGRLAMVHPDQIMYGASVPKIGILLAYFQLHPEASTNLAADTRHELGLMIKRSSNEMAAKYSKMLGLQEIQRVLGQYHFYDKEHGGGIWVGKHYGQGGERIGDPLADHSHAVTVRQLLRFCLLLEQGKLVNAEASKTMKEIFASPDITHENNKFVKGLAGKNVQILRKSGSWEDWLHDLAIVTGPNKHYIIAGLTKNPAGDDYLVDFARFVDEEL